MIGFIMMSPGFTIGEIAMRVMVMAYREMRANGATRQTCGTFGTLSDFTELWRVVQVETITIGTQYNVPRHLFPFIADLAYAVAMTEQFHLGSEMYCAWREYEIELHARAINANR